MPVNTGKFFVKVGAERGVFDVGDGRVEPVLMVVNRHSRPARPKMGVVVGAEKQIENTIFL